MTKYYAAVILKEILDDACFTGEKRDASEEGILALYKEHCRTCNSSKYLAIRCSQCHKPILLYAEAHEYDKDYNMTTFSAKCPYCSHQYEWNDCSWR